MFTVPTSRRVIEKWHSSERPAMEDGHGEVYYMLERHPSKVIAHTDEEIEALAASADFVAELCEEDSYQEPEYRLASLSHARALHLIAAKLYAAIGEEYDNEDGFKFRLECTSPEMFKALTGKDANYYHEGNQIAWMDWTQRVGGKEAERQIREYVRADTAPGWSAVHHA